MAKFSRIAALTVVSGALFFGSVSGAFATGSNTPKDPADGSSYAPVPANCVGMNAIKSSTYKVDGNVITQLRGKVPAGSKLSIEFILKDICKDVPMGLSAYQAASPNWVPAEAKLQVLVDSQKATLSGDSKTHKFEVQVPNCYFQVDFFTGTPVKQLDNRGGYFNGHLIAADNGGSTKCVPITTTTVKPTTTTTTPIVTTTSTTVPQTTSTTVPQTTSTVPQTTSTTVPQTTSTTVPQTTSTTVPQTTSTTVPQTTSTTVPQTTTVAPTTTTTALQTEVLSETIDAPAPQVASEELAKTGIETLPLALLGSGLTLSGAALTGFAARLRRK